MALLAALAADNHGVFSWSDMDAAGISRAARAGYGPG